MNDSQDEALNIARSLVAELVDKTAQLDQSSEEIEQLTSFLKELENGQFDIQIKLSDHSHQYWIQTCIYGSEVLKKQLRMNTLPKQEVVEAIIALFGHVLQNSILLSRELRDAVTILYVQFVCMFSKDDGYSLHARVAWMKEISKVLYSTAVAERNNPLCWVRYGRSQMVFSNLYQGTYSVIVLKHALQRLSSVDFFPDVKIMKGILYAELARLVDDRSVPKDLAKGAGSEIALTQEEKKKAPKLGFIDVNSMTVLPTETERSQCGGVTSPENQFRPGSYARLLWDKATTCFLNAKSELLNAEFHHRLCLGKWALMPRDSLEVDVMLDAARKCLSIVPFEEVTKLALEEEWWCDLKEQIRVIFSASLARVENKTERQLFLKSCPKELISIITNLEDE